MSDETLQFAVTNDTIYFFSKVSIGLGFPLVVQLLVALKFYPSQNPSILFASHQALPDGTLL